MQFDLFDTTKPDTEYNGFAMLNEHQKAETQGVIQRAIDSSGLNNISVVLADNGFKIMADNDFKIVDMFYYNSVMIRIISPEYIAQSITLWVYDTDHQKILYKIITDNLNAIKDIINEKS